LSGSDLLWGVTFRLMGLFDVLTALENAFAIDSTNLQLAAELARAKENYRYTKQYAVATAAAQEGATPEEIAAAQREASGEAGKAPEVEIDVSAAQALEEKIKAQRAEEQRLKLELVNKAKAELETAQREAARLEKERQDAAEAAAKADEAKKQSDALIALMQQAGAGGNAGGDSGAEQPAQPAGTPESTRRRLADDVPREKPLDMATCSQEFTTGVFKTDC
jgi:hypothetical protein